MLYYNNWCTLAEQKDKIIISVDKTDISIANNNEVFLNAVDNALKVVGSNPALCLSGGIDSQAMISIWKKSNKKFTAVTFDFGNNFNEKEIKDAETFANYCGIKITKIKLDIMRFLSRDLIDFADKFQMASPQFATHAYFLEIVRRLGFTGAICGGNGFFKTHTQTKFNLTKAQLLDIENYSQISKFPVIPSFLSFDRDLCQLLLSATEAIDDSSNVHELRYQNKIESYKKLGLDIIPQESKMTGFEGIKNYYNDLYKSYWAFEKDFRAPLLGKRPEKTIETVFPEVVSK